MPAPSGSRGLGTHQGWQANQLEQVLWEQAERSRRELEQGGEAPLCIWDSSVLEKAESQQLEGLGKVRSSKARRLARSVPPRCVQSARRPDHGTRL